MAIEVTPPRKSPAEYVAELTDDQRRRIAANENGVLERLIDDLHEAFEDAYRERAANA